MPPMSMNCNCSIQNANRPQISQRFPARCMDSFLSWPMLAFMQASTVGSFASGSSLQIIRQHWGLLTAVLKARCRPRGLLDYNTSCTTCRVQYILSCLRRGRLLALGCQGFCPCRWTCQLFCLVNHYMVKVSVGGNGAHRLRTGNEILSARTSTSGLPRPTSIPE